MTNTCKTPDTSSKTPDNAVLPETPKTLDRSVAPASTTNPQVGVLGGLYLSNTSTVQPQLPPPPPSEVERGSYCEHSPEGTSHTPASPIVHLSLSPELAATPSFMERCQQGDVQIETLSIRQQRIADCMNRVTKTLDNNVEASPSSSASL